MLGADTAAILREAGLSEEEIAKVAVIPEVAIANIRDPQQTPLQSRRSWIRAALPG